MSPRTGPTRTGRPKAGKGQNMQYAITYIAGPRGESMPVVDHGHDPLVVALRSDA